MPRGPKLIGIEKGKILALKEQYVINREVARFWAVRSVLSATSSQRQILHVQEVWKDIYRSFLQKFQEQYRSKR